VIADNGRTVMAVDDMRPVTTLWQLGLEENRLFCTIYRSTAGFELRLETGSAVILTEPFDMQPRMLARTQQLRAALKRRGWQEMESARNS
jgi:hypothetical protein